jgi:hypothetical protein
MIRCYFGYGSRCLDTSHDRSLWVHWGSNLRKISTSAQWYGPMGPSEWGEEHDGCSRMFWCVGWVNGSCTHVVLLFPMVVPGIQTSGHVWVWGYNILSEGGAALENPGTDLGEEQPLSACFQLLGAWNWLVWWWSHVFPCVSICSNHILLGQPIQPGNPNEDLGPTFDHQLTTVEAADL